MVDPDTPKYAPRDQSKLKPRKRLPPCEACGGRGWLCWPIESIRHGGREISAVGVERCDTCQVHMDDYGATIKAHWTLTDGRLYIGTAP